ncbi:MAG TPA: YlxR family protein [Tissierellia bacterium]|mgnify:FL=1|nr:YlxR family protein [Tissierellia bacterium]
MKKKKIPLRRCVACNEGKPKKELIRIVRNTEGKVEVDLTGKMNGRGAYICPDMNCLEKAIKSKRLSKVLEAEVTDEVFDRLYDIIREEKN